MGEKKVKAYVLTSGGLDSTLAVKMLQEQGVEVTGVYVSTGFCINSHQKKTGRFDDNKADVFKVTQELGIDLEVIDISREYIPIITNPRYGWGKNVNPCIDCRIHMLKKTAELMKENNIDFIATGEVLGQRPMSQRRHTMKLIEEKSGLKGYLLRPLSAKLNPLTEVEKNGWVDREKLGSLSGRSRKPQMAMARHYGLKTISAPAGGCCFLTDETFAVRFKDMIRDRKFLVEKDENQPIEMSFLMIMATGRHIKIRPGLNLVMGRNEAENKLLVHYADKQLVIEPSEDIPGPTALLQLIKDEKGALNKNNTEEIWKKYYSKELDQNIKDKINEFLVSTGTKENRNVSPEEIYLAASILKRYIKKNPEANIRFRVMENHKLLENCLEISMDPFDDEELLNSRIIMKANEENFTLPIL